MHKISKLEISNYRSCQSTNLNLERFSPLVGYNNAGKSNILKAIEALIRAKSLPTEDFNDSQKPVEIRAVVEGISDEALNHLPNVQRVEIEKFLVDESICIRFYQEEPKASKSSIALGVKNCLGASSDWEETKVLSKAISNLFPEPTFVNSMEDSAEDASKVKAGNTIGKLISKLQSEILKAKGEELNFALSEIGKKLNVDGSDRLQELSNFDDSLNDKIGSFFPGLELKVHIPTPSVSELFKKGTIQVLEENKEANSDFGKMGHGAQRAIQMTLIQHLSEVTRSATKEGKTNLLLIDEPELFLHPQAVEQVRSSLKLLSSQGYQVVFSTHSPFMIDRSDISVTNIVRKKTAGTFVSLRLKEAIAQTISENTATSRLLFDTYNLSQILFSNTVLVAEGDTERCVLPELFRAISAKTMGEAKVALVIARGSGSIPGMLKILSAMSIPAKALVDLDFAFRVASQPTVKLVNENSPSIEACLDILLKLQPEHGFELDGKFPKKGNGFKAHQVYELLAQQPESRVHIAVLQSELHAKDIWLWDSGAIESHLCLAAKSTEDWFRFNQKLSEGPVEEVLEDVEHITRFVNWCQGIAS